jgi:pimeloyl-ACP methyl ester carboxylesterase
VPVDPYGRFLVLRSAIGYLDAPPEERERIREIALAIGRQLDPAEIEGAIRTLSPGGVACVEALRRFHPDRQSEQWRRIVGGSRELIEALSVTESPERLRSRLMILHSVYDHILPCSGSLALHRRFPAADLVLTTLFTHVNVRVSPRALWTQVRELRALFRMLGGIIALQG